MSIGLWFAMTAVILALSMSCPSCPGVWAQSSDNAVCPPGWEWNENSLQQDPCTIASMLDAACRSIGQYGVPPLHSGQEYSPPERNSTHDLFCDCDTVMYSLYMACSSCQGGEIFSWTGWIAQCDSISVAQYPHDIAHGTAIPRWAFYDVTTLPNKTYSNNVAMSIGRDPEATPKPLSTLSLGSSTSTNVPSSTSYSTSSSVPAYPGQTSIAPNKKSNTAAIVGGVVGGVVPVIILIVVGAYFFGRRRSGGRPEETSEYFRGHPTSPTLTATSGLPYSTYHGSRGGYGGAAEL